MHHASHPLLHSTHSIPQSRSKRLKAAVLWASALLACSNPAWAVHLIGNIELDGNTANDGAAVAGIDDWDNVFIGNDHALRSAFVYDSASADQTAFTGGVKDTQTLDKWSCKQSTVQDKSNILHAYGATYSAGDELFFYAGIDREGNNGTSNVAVWLFQGPVACTSTGPVTPFSGTHLDGDLLLVAEFGQGGRVEAIQVYRWSDPNGIPQSGDECLGGNLGDCSDAGVPAFTGLNCNDSLPGDRVCGRTNPSAPINAAWRNGIPTQGFFEVGANLTALIGDIGCFANAVVETRSSTSLTATLKDFVILNMSTCGTLTVKKQTTGGNAVFGFEVDPASGGDDEFDLSGGDSQFFGTIKPGTYTVAEVTMPEGPAAPNGWNLTNLSCEGGSAGSPNYIAGGHGGGNIDVTIDLNDDVTCTFANTFTAPASSITVQKICDSETPDLQTFGFVLGGFGSSSTTACASGALTLACGEAITCNGLPAGPYTVSETVPAGWVLSDVSCQGTGTSCGSGLSPNAAITLGTDGSAVATFTNTENATLEICKSTIPAAAGDDFSFSGALGNFTLADGECTAPTEVEPGVLHDITEAANAGFTLESISCTGSNWLAGAAGTGSVSITPQAGEAVSCTFHNTENPAFIRVCKTTVTSGGINPSFEIELSGPDSDLPVTISLPDGSCDLGAGDPGQLLLVAGSGYAVNETPTDGWDSSVSCSGDENPANIVLSPDEQVTCTFTNTQRGQIIVTKLTQPAGDPAQFDFSGDLAGSISDGGMLSVEVVPGQYTVTESALAGWDLNSIVCDDGDSGSDGSTAIFNVAAGESVTCVFTNTRRGQITVEKQTIPDGDPALFDFSGDLAGSISDGGSISAEVVPGQHTVTESAMAGWDLSSIVCDDGDSGSDGATAIFNVAAGESVTCVFTNTRRGQITVEKQTIPDGDPAQFSFSGDLAGSISDGGTLSAEVVPGQHSATESALAGWDLSSISCDDGDSGSDGATAIFNVAPGESVTCVFTNTKRSGLTIIKQTNGVDGEFCFTANGPDANLNFCIQTSNGLGEHTETNLTPGNYTISEQSTSGWKLVSSSCADGSPVSNASLEPDENLTCTFVNMPTRATFAVSKVFSDGDNPSAVTATISCNTGLPLDQSKSITTGQGVTFVVNDFDSGEMDCTVAEQPGSLAGYTPNYLASGPGSSNDSTGCHYADVTGGGNFTCVITNHADLVEITIEKRWVIEGAAMDFVDTRYSLTLFCDAQIAGGQADCSGITDAKGRSSHNYTSCRSFQGDDSASFLAEVTPNWPESHCRVVEQVYDNSVEIDNACQNLKVSHGQGDLCLITNTVFFEGIPMLGAQAKALLALLLLSIGLLAFRRIT